MIAQIFSDANNYKLLVVTIDSFFVAFVNDKLLDRPIGFTSNGALALVNLAAKPEICGNFSSVTLQKIAVYSSNRSIFIWHNWPQWFPNIGFSTRFNKFFISDI